MCTHCNLACGVLVDYTGHGADHCGLADKTAASISGQLSVTSGNENSYLVWSAVGRCSKEAALVKYSRESEGAVRA